MTLGARLRMRRMTCGVRNGYDDGYPQSLCAEKMGIAQPHYSRIENDVEREDGGRSSRVSLWPLVALAEFYGMSLEQAFPEFKPTPREKRQLAIARAARKTVTARAS